jgi:hypothetical protein
MPISQFKEEFVARLKIDQIREKQLILNENDFEQKFIVPTVFAINSTDIFLYSHPWGNKVRCAPDCDSAREGKGHIREGCPKCWKKSKDWGTVNAFGTQNKFDLVAEDTKDGKLAVEIKFVSFTKGRRPDGEIQRFLGQCTLAASKFDFVVGVCGYSGMLNPEYDWDTEKFKHWAEKHNIDIVFRCISTETFANYEIEWITLPSFKFKRFLEREEFHYTDRHGVKLYYKDEKQELLVGFIEGYQWYHAKRGPVRIYILTHDSKEWGELLRDAKQILNELKEAIYEVLERQPFRGRIKGNIYGSPNG